MLDQTTISDTYETASMTGNSFIPQSDLIHWIVDTGVSHHMIGNPHLLYHLKGLIDNARHVQLPTDTSAKCHTLEITTGATLRIV